MKEENQFIIQEDPLIVAYKLLEKNTAKFITYYILGVLSLGILFLVVYWFPELEFLLYDEKTDFSESSHICLMNEKTFTIIEIKTQKVLKTPHTEKKFESFFIYNHGHYSYDENEGIFTNFENTYSKNLAKNFDPKEIKSLTNEEAKELQKLYGNNIIKLEHENLLLTLVKVICSPLNIYEIILFLIDAYYAHYGFAALLLFYVVVQVVLEIWSIREKIDKINSLSASVSNVTVIRRINNSETKIVISSKNVVIGDIVLIRPMQKLKYDVLVIEGSCLINQAVLTGESMPVEKSVVKKGEKIRDVNYIYSGSDCLLLRAREIRGVVVNTAWSTFKGKLVGKLLNTRLKEFKFEKDVKYYVGVLMFVFTLIAIFLIYIDIRNGHYNQENEITRFIEIITCAVPPSLFFAFAVVSRMISSRLKDHGVFCLIDEKIKESGRIKNVCFDKTGTLTENDIKVSGYIVSNHGDFETSEKNIHELISFDNYRYLIEILACCNNLNILKGDIIGDPIEEKMFQETKFQFLDTLKVSFVEDNSDVNRYQIVPTKEYKKICKLPNNFVYNIYKTIQFDSERKRMTTIITNEKRNDHKYTVLTKGAPEIMKTHCDPSTIPEDYDQILIEYSEQGLRILTLAYRKINEIPEKLDDCENNLIFLGFLLLNNPIKPESEIIINKLKTNGVDCNMITGDNLFTAINIGIQTGIVEEDQNIWVGEYKNNKYIKWVFFNNNELMEKMETKTRKNITIEGGSFRESNLLKSIIKVDEFTTIGYQEIYKVFENIEKSNTILAVDGDSFEELMRRFKSDEEMKLKILNKTKIFGRTKPLQKKMIVEQFREKLEKDDYCVGFVGDGSNDCHALHASNLGLSIGNNESSIASSFSTNLDNISPIIEIIKEGKFLLENSIQIFKLTTYMGIMESFGIVILAYYQMNFTVWHYTFGILFWIPNFLLMSLQKPSKFNQFFPKAGVINKEVFLSLFYSVFIMLFFMCFVSSYLFYRLESKETQNITLNLNTRYLAFIEPLFIFFFHSTNNIFFSFALNRGYPFKEPFWTNMKFMVYNFFIYLFMLSLIFSNLFEEYFVGKVLIKEIPLPDYTSQMRNKVLMISLMFNLTSVLFEMMLNKIFLINKLKSFENKLCKKNIALSVSNLSK